LLAAGIGSGYEVITVAMTLSPRRQRSVLCRAAKPVFSINPNISETVERYAF
jgi:hypothetical protein